MWKILIPWTRIRGWIPSNLYDVSKYLPVHNIESSHVSFFECRNVQVDNLLIDKQTNSLTDCMLDYDRCQVKWFTLSLVWGADQNDHSTKSMANRCHVIIWGFINSNMYFTSTHRMNTNSGIRESYIRIKGVWVKAWTNYQWLRESCIRIKGVWVKAWTNYQWLRESCVRIKGVWAKAWTNNQWLRESCVRI